MPCSPNPCLHGGVCKDESIETFSCDCSGTSYTGESCEIGVISMPSILQLKVNRTSEELSVNAKPNGILQIRPKYDKNNMKFVPEKIKIYPSINEAKFRITVFQIGVFKVEFELVGLDATSFEKPKQLTVYAYQKIDTQSVDIDTNFLDANCNDLLINWCDKKIKLTSSCSWKYGTNGFTGVESEDLKIPLSLVGLDEKTARSFMTAKFLNPSNEFKKYLGKGSITTPCLTSCNNSNYNNDAINFITKSNLFQRTYLQLITSILPPWVHINIDQKERYFDTYNFLTFLGNSANVRKIKQCHLSNTYVNDVHSVYLPKSLLRFSIGSTSKSTADIEQPTCFTINLCQKTLSILLHKNNYLNYAEDLINIGMSNVIVRVKGFTFGINESLCTSFEKVEKCTVVNAFADVLLTSFFNFNAISISAEGSLYTALDDKVNLICFVQCHYIRS